MKYASLSSFSRKNSGFSLVEVVLALGICSFAMVAIVGMIPVGLSTFKDAMNTTVQSQIVQRIAGEVVLVDYQNLASQSVETYYNDQGAQVTDSGAIDLAYTARVEPPVVLSKVGEGSSPTPGEKVVIKIAKTHPGQSFDAVENVSPHGVYKYSVIVARN